MYNLQRLRFKSTLQKARELLMALDLRMFTAAAAEGRPKSSASTPSLRAHHIENVVDCGTVDVAKGNVKVAVRVRRFLPRGK